MCKNQILGQNHSIQFVNATLWKLADPPLRLQFQLRPNDSHLPKINTGATEFFVSKLKCPICLDVIKNTMTSKECMHRFCSDCIKSSLRLGKKECPLCREKLATIRSLCLDPHIDLLISQIFQNDNQNGSGRAYNANTIKNE